MTAVWGCFTAEASTSLSFAVQCCKC